MKSCTSRSSALGHTLRHRCHTKAANRQAGSAKYLLAAHTPLVLPGPQPKQTWQPSSSTAAASCCCTRHCIRNCQARKSQQRKHATAMANRQTNRRAAHLSSNTMAMPSSRWNTSPLCCQNRLHWVWNDTFNAVRLGVRRQIKQKRAQRPCLLPGVPGVLQQPWSGSAPLLPQVAVQPISLELNQACLQNSLPTCTCAQWGSACTEAS